MGYQQGESISNGLENSWMSYNFIESIYVLDLLNTRLDIKVMGILFLFSPVLLLLWKKNNPLLFATGIVVLGARIIVPFVPPSFKIIVAGIGAGAFLHRKAVPQDIQTQKQQPE